MIRSGVTEAGVLTFTSFERGDCGVGGILACGGADGQRKYEEKSEDQANGKLAVLQAIFELTVHAGFAKEAASRIELESDHCVFETAISMGRFKPFEKNEIVGGASVDAVTFEGNRTVAKFAFDVRPNHAGF